MNIPRFRSQIIDELRRAGVNVEQARSSQNDAIIPGHDVDLQSTRQQAKHSAAILCETFGMDILNRTKRSYVTSYYFTDGYDFLQVDFEHEMGWWSLQFLLPENFAQSTQDDESRESDHKSDIQVLLKDYFWGQKVNNEKFRSEFKAQDILNSYLKLIGNTSENSIAQFRKNKILLFKYNIDRRGALRTLSSLFEFLLFEASLFLGSNGAVISITDRSLIAEMRSCLEKKAYPLKGIEIFSFRKPIRAFRNYSNSKLIIYLFRWPRFKSLNSSDQVYELRLNARKKEFETVADAIKCIVFDKFNK